MTENFMEVKGIAIELDNNMLPTQLKEIGYYNGIGKKIVTKVVVGKEVYCKLKELYGDFE